LEALRTETSHLNPISPIYNYSRSINNKLWISEIMDHYAVLDTHGGEAYSESVDIFRLNWYIKLFEKWAPY